MNRLTLVQRNGVAIIFPEKVFQVSVHLLEPQAMRDITMPATLNLGPFHRGDTVPLALSFTDGVTPIDMRGKTVTFTLKLASAQGDTEAALSKSYTPEAGDTDAQGGLITVTIEHSESIGLITSHPYSYSIRMIEPASPEPKETTYIVGTFTLVDA